MKGFITRFRQAAVCAAFLGLATQAQEAGLLGHWRFTPDRLLGGNLKPTAGGPDAALRGSVSITKDPGPARAELTGRDEQIVLADDLAKALLPKREITAEAWVRVDRPQQWGGIVGAVQDNGDFERGWVLGFVNSQFSFALTSETGKRLTYLKAATSFETNRWYHVVGTYDGAEQRVYVNGRLAATSREQSGAILYPPNAPVVIGAYRDTDEHYRMTGAIHEVRLFQRALAADEIQQRFAARQAEFPEPAPPPKILRLAYGPFADWVDRATAVVTWETDAPMPTRLELEAPDGSKTLLGSGASTRRHEVILGNLKPDLEYHYRIQAPPEGETAVFTRRHQFDTSFHYEPAVPPSQATQVGGEDGRYAGVAKHILDTTNVRDGYCLVLGAEDGRLALELIRQSGLEVVVVEPDARKAAAARQTLDRAGVYGVRASVHRVTGNDLPYGSLIANLIVSESALATGRPPWVSAKEVHRLVRPVGGTVCLGAPATGFAKNPLAQPWRQWLEGSELASAKITDEEGLWVSYSRERLAGAGDWSHQYGSADNTSCSQDELVSGELEVAWWGDPGPRPMPDRGNRNPAPLSVNGRLFIQGNRVLFGLDAYNGNILWSLSAPEVRRANVTRDCSNMAAAGDHLYVAHSCYCLALDGQTGARSRRYEVVENTPGADYEWGYLAAAGDWLLGSRQKRGAHYLGDDGEWYEDYAPDQVSRVTSDRLFLLDRTDGSTRWTYRGGVILNSTISIGDGMVVFLESRNPAALAEPTSRVHPDLLTDQHLVALDLRTGRQLWTKGHDLGACQFMTYLVYSQNKVVVSGTDKDKNFHTFAFSAPSPERPAGGGDDLENAIPGRLLWSEKHKEDKGHHSGHLQHPLVIGDVFYSDQRAFDLGSGRLLRTDLPERRGCGVMSASRNAVFFRHYFHGMWDLATNKRTQFEGIRGGCWLGLIPAGGMLLAPESSAGCSCTHAIQISVGYLPKSLAKR